MRPTSPFRSDPSEPRRRARALPAERWRACRRPWRRQGGGYRAGDGGPAGTGLLPTTAAETYSPPTAKGTTGKRQERTKGPAGDSVGGVGERSVGRDVDVFYVTTSLPLLCLQGSLLADRRMNRVIILGGWAEFRFRANLSFLSPVSEGVSRRSSPTPRLLHASPPCWFSRFRPTWNGKRPGNLDSGDRFCLTGDPAADLPCL